MKKNHQKPLRLLGRCALVLCITFFLLIVYELSVRYVWEAVFWSYYILLAAASILVVVCNRGFSRRFYRREELPSAWSEAQKDEFFAEAATWWRKTSPVCLYLILPLCLTFAFDILCLFLWGPLIDLFPFLA